jgi:hypothetical protein
MVQKLWGFKDFSQTLGMLLATANAAKSAQTAQNCPNLLKYARRQNFEIPPKIEILEFFKNKDLYV